MCYFCFLISWPQDSLTVANVCCFSCPETSHLETVPDFPWVTAPPTWVHVGFSHLEVGVFILCSHLRLLIVLEMPGRHLWFGKGEGGAHGFPSPKPMGTEAQGGDGQICVEASGT